MAVGPSYYGGRAVILWQPYICYNIASLRTAWMRGNRIDECTSSRQGWKRIPRKPPLRAVYGMMREPATQLGWQEMRKGAARSMSGQPDGDAFGDATPTRRAGNSPPAQRSSNPRKTKEPGRPNKEKKITELVTELHQLKFVSGNNSGEANREITVEQGFKELVMSRILDEIQFVCVHNHYGETGDVA